VPSTTAKQASLTTSEPAILFCEMLCELNRDFRNQVDYAGVSRGTVVLFRVELNLKGCCWCPYWHQVWSILLIYSYNERFHDLIVGWFRPLYSASTLVVQLRPLLFVP
jgi:hypothetical protein